MKTPSPTATSRRPSRTSATPSCPACCCGCARAAPKAMALVEPSHSAASQMAATNKCLAQSNKSRTGIPATNKRPAARRNSSARRQLGVPVAGSALPVFHRPLAARVAKLNMSLHHPDLYFFLCLLTGLAAFLAIECILKFCRPKPPVVLPLDGLQFDSPAPPTEERASKPPSDFGRLSESVKALPPKEQASRVREHFGIFGGARPAEGRGRRAKNAGH